MSYGKFDLSLYGILDPGRSMGRDLVDLAEASIAGGVTFLQLRDKKGTTKSMVKTARRILEVARPRNVPLVINDRVDVAFAAAADGVHLGQEDMAPEDARRLLGADAIIGVTIHSLAEADAAPVKVADYYGVGGIYATASKHNPDAPIGIDGFAMILDALKGRDEVARLVGIAGIDLSNTAPVIAAGADGVAIISAIYMQDDPQSAARHFSGVIADSRSRAGL